MNYVKVIKMARGRQSKYLWVAFTPDHLQLPIFVEDSAESLGRKLGIDRHTVSKRAKLEIGIVRIRKEEDDYETRNN